MRPTMQPMARFDKLASTLRAEPSLAPHVVRMTRGASPSAGVVSKARNVAAALGGTLGGMPCIVAVMTHSFAAERAVLRSIGRTRLRYLGLLGPRERTDRLLAEVFDDDATGIARMRARLHSPIGLDIGAEGPSEIALAIVAEIRAVLAHRRGGHLRARSAPLHGVQPALFALLPDEYARRRSAIGGRR